MSVGQTEEDEPDNDWHYCFIHKREGRGSCPHCREERADRDLQDRLDER
jgi:hypothetical protein